MLFTGEIGTGKTLYARLLQVLQDATFSRAGAEEVLRTDARVIAATNADLAAMNDTGGSLLSFERISD